MRNTRLMETRTQSLAGAPLARNESPSPSPLRLWSRGASEERGGRIRRGVRSLQDALARHHRVEPDMVLVGNRGPTTSCSRRRGRWCPRGRSPDDQDMAALPVVVESAARASRWPRRPPYDLVVDSLVERGETGFGCCFVAGPKTLRHAFVLFGSARGCGGSWPPPRAWAGTVVVTRLMDTSPSGWRGPRVFRAAPAGLSDLKTFSKAYGLAGIRVAYAVGPVAPGRGRSSATPQLRRGQLGLTAAGPRWGSAASAARQRRETRGWRPHSHL